MKRLSQNTAAYNGGPDNLLTLVDVHLLMSLSRSTFYRIIENGRCPKPLKIGNTSRWPSSEAVHVIETCKRERAAALGFGEAVQ